MYNQAKYTSAVARVLGEWLDLENEDLDNLTVLSMFYNTGIEVDLKIDSSRYEDIIETHSIYATYRNKDVINVW